MNFIGQRAPNNWRLTHEYNMDAKILAVLISDVKDVMWRPVLIALQICTLLVFPLPSHADIATDINRGATAFYRIYLEVRVSGVPSAKTLARFAPVVSPSLLQLLQKAEAAEKHYARLTNHAVPPLVEGDLFTSLFEGAQAFAVQECHRGATGSAACTIRLQYADAAAKAPTNWTDKIFLIKHDRRWVVEDIEYGGDWQFMHKGRLRELLRRVIRDGSNAKPAPR